MQFLSFLSITRSILRQKLRQKRSENVRHAHRNEQAGKLLHSAPWLRRFTLEAKFYSSWGEKIVY
jgi:hypothetical protein